MAVKQKPLHQAWQSFDRARRCYADFVRTEREFHIALEHWEDFLGHSVRCANKLRAAFPKGHHLLRDMKNVQDAEPTVTYLFQARHANEHTLAEIAQPSPGFLAINSTDGDLVVERLTIGPDLLNAVASKNARFTVQHPGIELLPITNRGDLYHPPEEQSGPLAERIHAQDAGMTLIAFLHSFLERAARAD